jgi:hypothetical protein
MSHSFEAWASLALTSMLYATLLGIYLAQPTGFYYVLPEKNVFVNKTPLNNLPPLYPFTFHLNSLKIINIVLYFFIKNKLKFPH